MSGIEVAGLVLGAFPLIISCLEHWHKAAKVGGFFWRVRKEYEICLHDAQFNEILYRKNLEELLLPIMTDEIEMAHLIGDPGGIGWSDPALRDRLEARLQKSYGLYMGILGEMNETAKELRKHLSLDDSDVQNNLASPDATVQRQQASLQPDRLSKYAYFKSKWTYETFRLRFSFTEDIRKDLFDRLKECNNRLEKLLNKSDKISALQNVAPGNRKHASALAAVFKKSSTKSDRLFRALQTAWHCSCQLQHVANLRLEHRTLADVCFEVILMFDATSSWNDTPWSWQELQCGHMLDCSIQNTFATPSQTSSVGPPAPKRRKLVAFKPPASNTVQSDCPMELTIQLCQRLGKGKDGDCIGIISHDGEQYHLHPFAHRVRLLDSEPLTLNQILLTNGDGTFDRRERYSVALLLASSVAQLQFTPWLRTGLTKDDVLFYPCKEDDCLISYHEPFIRQGFRDCDDHPQPDSGIDDYNFFSLGILLLELCFGKRLEDHPQRQRLPAASGGEKQAYDLQAAISWSQKVAGEGGDDYACAVNWCFTRGYNAAKSWRIEIIKNVVRPLEMCQEHFKTAALV